MGAANSTENATVDDAYTQDVTATETTAMCLEVTMEEVWRAAIGGDTVESPVERERAMSVDLYPVLYQNQDLAPISGTSFEDSTWNTVDVSVNGWQKRSVVILLDDSVTLSKRENGDKGRLVGKGGPLPMGLVSPRRSSRGRQSDTNECRAVRGRSLSRDNRGTSKTRTRSRSTKKHGSRGASRDNKQKRETRVSESISSRERGQERRTQRGNSSDRRQGREVRATESSESSDLTPATTRDSSRGTGIPSSSSSPAERSRHVQRSSSLGKVRGHGTKNTSPPSVKNTQRSASKGREVVASNSPAINTPRGRSAGKKNKPTGEEEDTRIQKHTSRSRSWKKISRPLSDEEALRKTGRSRQEVMVVPPRHE
jgi:hypothetical protein